MDTIPDVLNTLADVIDPDVGINVVDLGLVEAVEIAPGRVRVGLIMTTPACPQSAYLRDEAARLLLMEAAAGTDIEVDILPEPLWQPDRLSERARVQLGWRA